jgi:3-mercaptopyruvate sulfurtransferase SseA
MRCAPDDTRAVKARNGRHPLPVARLAAARPLGVSDSQVVVYDAGGCGASDAALVGHAAVALLGGLPAWKATGLPLQTGAVAPPAGRWRWRPTVANVGMPRIIDRARGSFRPARRWTRWARRQPFLFRDSWLPAFQAGGQLRRRRVAVLRPAVPWTGDRLTC